MSLLSSCTWRCLPSGCLCARMNLHALCACCVSVHCSYILNAWGGCALSPIFLSICLCNACGLSLLSFYLSHSHMAARPSIVMLGKHRALTVGTPSYRQRLMRFVLFWYMWQDVSEFMRCSWAVRQGGSLCMCGS